MTIQLWRSRKGAEIQEGPLRFTLLEGGDVQRWAVDFSIVGLVRTHQTKIQPGTFEQMAREAVESWRNRRHEWKECPR